MPISTPRKPDAYAAGTKVPMERTLTEIHTLVEKYGGQGWTVADHRRAQHPHYYIEWEMRGLLLRWTIYLPAAEDVLRQGERAPWGARERKAWDAMIAKRLEHEIDRTWRECLLDVRATLVRATSERVVFEEAVLGHVVTKSGATMGQYTAAVRKTLPPGQWLPAAEELLALPEAQPVEGQYRITEE